MTLATHCPNCGAPIDLARKTCAYCDSPYIFARGSKVEITADAITFSTDGAVVASFYNGVITANEARRLMSLPEV